jgi:hypothetical protein
MRSTLFIIFIVGLLISCNQKKTDNLKPNETQMYRFYDFNMTLDISCGLMGCEDIYQYIFCGEPTLINFNHKPVESKEVQNFKDITPEHCNYLDTMTLYYIVKKRCLWNSLGVAEQDKNENDTSKFRLSKKQVDSLFILITSLFILPFKENLSKYTIPPPPAPDGCGALLTLDLGFRGGEYSMSLDYYDSANLNSKLFFEYLINIRKNGL